MPQYSYLTEPTPEEIHRITALYRQAGWWPENGEDPLLVSRIISGSHCFAIAETSGLIVGMGRAISDRASDAYIQDVVVDKDSRGVGIGTKIVQMLIHRLCKDGLTWIGLIAERNSHQFYQQLGFEIMPDATPLIHTPTSLKPN